MNEEIQKRRASVHRVTGETDISLSLTIDGTGASRIETGIGFFDHMLTSFSRHGFFDLDVQCRGDLHVDGHHTVEDCGLVLGEAIKNALGEKSGIRRFGQCILPMDEALVLCAVDLSGRPYYCADPVFSVPMVGDFDTQLVQEFFYAVSMRGEMNLHFCVLRGENAHHVIEAMMKAFGKALDQAVSYEPRLTGVLSTKGSL